MSDFSVCLAIGHDVDGSPFFCARCGRAVLIVHPSLVDAAHAEGYAAVATRPIGPAFDPEGRWLLMTRCRRVVMPAAAVRSALRGAS